MNIYLIGYRCTGKTSIGRQLAKKMNLPFFDTDEGIIALEGLDIATIVAKNGWKYFRNLEKQVLTRTTENDPCVVSTGGGIILDPANRQILRTYGFCIWLRAKTRTIIDRFQKDAATASQRPSLTRLSLIEETRTNLEQRNPQYEKTQHFMVDTDQHTPNECADHILRRIEHVRL